MEGIKEREDGERGDYLRVVINQGTAIIQGNMVCIFSTHVSGLQEHENDKPWFDFFFYRL